MKKIVQIAGPVMTVALFISPAFGQAAPAVTSAPSYEGYQLPSIPGTLTYSLTGSERVQSGAYQSGSPRTLMFSGNLGLLTASPVHPFSMIYSGGELVSEGGGNSYSFHDLTLSQQYTTKSWQFLATDNVSYTPESSWSGLSGVPGAGDAGQPPTGPSDGVLTNDQSRISNSTSGSAFRSLTGRTSVGVQGEYELHRFLGNNQFPSLYSNDMWTMGPVMRYQLNALNALTANYTYTDMTYGTLLGKVLVQSLTVNLDRHWTRKFATSFGGGPQRVTGEGYNFTVQGLATYQAERGGVSVNFMHGVQSGGGVSAGIRQTSVSGTLNRQLGYQWSGTVTGAYRDSSELAVLIPTSSDYRSVLASAQMNRALLRHLSAYASYTLERQIVGGGQASPLALNGLLQYFAFGITYTPSSLNIGRH